MELLATADDEEKKEEFLSQPIAIVKEARVVESDEGVEVEEAAEGEAVDDGENQKTTDESENQD